MTIAAPLAPALVSCGDDATGVDAPPPDGMEIAFVSTRDGNPEIYVMRADGSNPVNLTKDDAGSDAHPTWSPDGAKIAFQSTRDGNWEIYLMDADGSNQVRLTNDQGLRPAWSPVSH